MNNIIFTHYGYSDYLFFTLNSAKFSNPDMRVVLLGDENNKEIAQKAGCEHFMLCDFSSEFIAEFNSVFRWVQGAKHNPIKNGKDWLRYVFERWYIIEVFCREYNINEFWHFDSDVMIVESLKEYGQILKADNVHYTKQCGGTCLNGYINYDILPYFLKYTTDLFKNENFLLEQQKEFDEVNPNFAFTEMRAFDFFSKQSSFKGVILESHFDGVWFDDALAQDDGFDTVNFPLCKWSFKKIYSNNGRFYAYKNGQNYNFVVLNCSWLPSSIYQWIFKNLKQKSDSFIGSVRIKMIFECFKKILTKIYEKIIL